MPVTQTGRKFSRRQFIKISALVGAAAGLSAVTIDRLLAIGELTRVQDTRLLMGALGTLTIISDTPDRARQAIQTAFDRMTGLESILSHYRPDSQLSRLNDAGYLADAAPDLQAVLARAVHYGDLTDGLFDVTIEPLHRQYREGAKTGNLPTREIIEHTLPLIDYRQIELNGKSVRLRKPGMALTLDGLGKGYVIDQGASVLLSLGFGNVLVEVGGDMQARGHAHEDGWRIGIASPTRPDQQIVAVARLNDCALTTSGDYEDTFTADRRLNHILDPRTGVSPLTLSSASVIAPTTCDADALSTSLMILGPQAGFGLLKRLPGTEALLVTKQGEVLRTAGFPSV